MRRPSCGILFLLLTLTGLSAADWQVPEAPYRITVKSCCRFRRNP